MARGDRVVSKGPVAVIVLATNEEIDRGSPRFRLLARVCGTLAS